MNNRKKIIKRISVILCIIALYFSVISIIYSTSDAEYLYDAAGDFIGIKFNNNEYTDDYYMPERYKLIAEDVSSFSRRYYIKYGDYFSDYLPPFSYFCFYSNEFDEYTNFIIEHPHDSEACIHIKKDMVLPTLNRNKVDMVCMSLGNKDEDNIKDKETIDKIVECAKSDGKIELDKEIVDYIKKYSWDYHCFYLKYEGYPIGEEFHIKETEDGKYTIDQFTPEEYDTVYYDEELHP